MSWRGREEPGTGILRAVNRLRRTAHIIMNPAANKGRAVSRRELIASYLERRGIEIVWHMTKEPGHADSIVRGLPEDALVVAAGGDGTVREVAAVCAKTERVLAILPLGSGNDYVKALGVGTGLDGALEVLARGNIRAVDAGKANGMRFCNGLGIGFDAQVAAGVATAPRYLGGFGRYMWSVGRLLWGFDCHDAVLRLDGEKVVESRTILVAAALGTTYGARFRLAPKARLDDGLFDVVWSEEVSRSEVLRLIPRAFGDSLLEHPKIHMARSAEVTVEFTEEIPAHVDGEILKPTRAFHAKVLPGALRVLVP